MACGGCANRSAARAAKAMTKEGDLLGGYKYLPRRQINARLDAYKRRFCSSCDQRYECVYEVYLKCEKRLSK
jgi:hypothetical protein